MILENDIDWNLNAEGRKESKARSLTSRLEIQKKSIQTLEFENREQIASAQENAYSALEEVVDLLLTVSDGNARLSRGNTPILSALAASVQRFSDLSDVARDNMRELGASAGDCMSMGDEADLFIRTLREHHRALGMEQKAITPIMKGYLDEYSDLRGRESALRSSVDTARSSLNDIGNAFLGFLDSSVKERLVRNAQDAQNRLDENLRRQETKKSTYEELYKCTCVARLAGAATLSLKVKVIAVSDDFDAAFVEVTGTQEIETKLWKGLMKLENGIYNTDYRSTRDNSLRIILQLLTADDQIFPAGSYAAQVETNIKAKVNSKLGAEALKKLLAPAISMNVEDFEL